MDSFRFNMKCVIQGLFVVGVWWGTSSTVEDRNGFFPPPEFTLPSIGFAAGLFWLTYFVNAVMDVKFGCEHGSLYDAFK